VDCRSQSYKFKQSVSEKITEFNQIRFRIFGIDLVEVSELIKSKRSTGRLRAFYQTVQAFWSHQ